MRWTGWSVRFAGPGTWASCAKEPDPKIAARMLHATVLGVLHGAMVEPELMDLKRDGMLALDMTLAAYVKDGVFVPGTVPEPLPDA